MIARVKLEYGPYSGEITVNCSEDEENEVVIARAWKRASSLGWLSLSMAASSAKIIERISDEAC